MAHADGRLLGDIYDCPENPALWNNVLDEVCERVGVRSAVIQVFERAPQGLNQQWCVRDSESHALADLHDAFVNNPSNPRLAFRMAPARRNGILRDQDLFPAGCPEFGRLRQNLAEIGLGAYLGGSLELSADTVVGLVLHRRLGDEREFGAADEALLAELLPHVRRAVRLSQKLESLASGEAALRQAMDHLRPGLLLCAPQGGNVHWANAAARSILARSRTASLRGDKLRCSRRRDAAALARFVEQFQPGEVLRLGDADDGEALHVFALHVGVPVRVLMLTEAAAPAAPDLASVRRLFDLSPAEASLAIALCAGKSVNEHADERGVSVGTARIQLKRILAKTGTHRQGELIRRICGSPAAQASV